MKVLGGMVETPTDVGRILYRIAPVILQDPALNLLVIRRQYYPTVLHLSLKHVDWKPGHDVWVILHLYLFTGSEGFEALNSSLQFTSGHDLWQPLMKPLYISEKLQVKWSSRIKQLSSLNVAQISLKPVICSQNYACVLSVGLWDAAALISLELTIADPLWTTVPLTHFR